MIERLKQILADLWKAFEDGAIGTAEWLDGDDW
jgi:hypothetical protein